ncbi:Sorting nexin-7 [Trichoplax sp. H2]|nr:Sorting nexin-7 [Trichoplax sp. H2]|eukprot:RDD37881.1 Sorting nexin-7 [Trichoplax sp. H2]
MSKTIADDSDLVLSCTLCSEKIRITDLESHSKTCNSHIASTSVSVPTSPKSVHKEAIHTLIINVTCIDEDQESPFKIITKTNLTIFDKSLIEVNRSKQDLIWLREALQMVNPERIVPPLRDASGKSKIETVQEMQRFLSRISRHKILRKHPYFKVFITGSNEELKSIQNDYSQLENPYETIHHKPIRMEKDENSTLRKAQDYMNTLIANLTMLQNNIEEMDKSKISDTVFHAIEGIGHSEPSDTFLQEICSQLCRMQDEADKNKNLINDQSLILDILSLIAYVQSAKTYLDRIERAIDNFLFWEEEARQYENANSQQPDGKVVLCSNEDLDNPFSESRNEVLSKQNASKAHLEVMCLDMSNEIEQFDYQKELEMQQILLEYSERRCKVYEQYHSKWAAMKYTLEIPIDRRKRAIVVDNME